MMMWRASSARVHAIAAGCLTLIVLAGVANAEGWSARLGAEAGRQTVASTDDPDNGDYSLYGLSAAALYNITDRLYVQASAQFEEYTIKGWQAPDRTIMTGLHVGLRNPQRGLVGMFVASVEANIDDAPTGYGDSGTIGGLEGQYYMDDYTFYGQVGTGYVRVDGPPSPEGFVDGTFWRIGGRFFPNDNFMIDLSYTGASTCCYIDGNDPGDWDSISVRAYMKLAKFLYGFLSFRNSTFYAIDEEDRADDRAFMVGFDVRFGKGAASLREFDRTGASLDLPMTIARGVSYTEALD